MATVLSEIVAGGGQGGCTVGGGGGAGGVLTASDTITTVVSLSVVVGAGGTGATGTAHGIAGGNSSFNSHTATGGGGGAGNGIAATNGGSGGGGGNSAAAGSGTAGQGHAGGTSSGVGPSGGGGAGAVGTSSSGTIESAGVAGGAGVASTVPGSALTFGGGGGSAGVSQAGTTFAGGAGGTGGGGAGGSSDNSTPPVAGGANTGGGGGGGGYLTGTGYTGAAGGSGRVTIWYLTGTLPAGTYATGGTITISGSYTIHTFLANGTFAIVAFNPIPTRLFPQDQSRRPIADLRRPGFTRSLDLAMYNPRPDGLYIDVLLAGTGIWTDITKDTRQNLGATLVYGMSDGKPTTRVATTGKFEFYLNNANTNSGGVAGYYSPNNVNCRTGFKQNIPCRLVRVLNNVPYYKHVGRLRIITPLAGQNLDQYTDCVSLDYMDDLARASLSGLTTQTNATADQILKLVIAAMATMPNAEQFDVGVNTFPWGLVAGSGGIVNPLQEAQRCTMSEQGYLYVKGDTSQGGILRFENQTARATSASKATLANTMGVNPAGKTPLDAEADAADVINGVQATVHPRKVVGAVSSEIVLFNTLTPIKIAPGATVTVNATYRDPNQTATAGQGQIAGTDMLTPVATTDYTGNTDPSGAGGTDITSSISIVTTQGGTGATFAITNANAATAYVLLQQRGVGLFDYGPQIAPANDGASQALYGINVIAIDLPYLSDPNVGQSMATAIVDQWKNPFGYAQDVSFQANSSPANLLAACLIEIGDPVTITETITGISAVFIVNGIEWDIKPGGWITCTWLLAPTTKRVNSFTTPVASHAFVVPPGITTITVKVWGAGGGAGNSGANPGGGGGFAQGDVTVTPGETLLLSVGGAGNNGSANNAGSGGGYSGLFRGSTPLIVAGAGGGASGTSAAGGAGGGTTGTAGGADGAAGGGGGGTNAAGGALGSGNSSNGTAGSSLTGGAGDYGTATAAGVAGGLNGGGVAGNLSSISGAAITYTINAGGGGQGGGGGATGANGQVLTGTDILSSGAYAIVVGSGGAGGAGTPTAGSAGTGSSFNGHAASGGAGGAAAVANVDYCIVAGGGGGGSVGGGGGGGQVLQGTDVLAAGAYTVTVGAGGTAGNFGVSGGTGSISSFNGHSAAGGLGGVGGGSNYGVSGGASGSGNAGGNAGGDVPANDCGGGGGDGGVGGDGTDDHPINSGGGQGGIGTVSSISGVTYGAGGGGAAVGNLAPAGGATSGAGTGGNNLGTNATDATANSGGGGGGGNSTSIAGAGGSGIVELRFLTASGSATGGSQTTSGPYTICTFTSSGTFTFTPGNGSTGATGNAGSVQLQYLTGTATSTGGSSVISGPYTVVTFTSNGTFTLTAPTASNAGGGGGGGYYGGGGGAGTSTNAGGGGGGSSYTTGANTSTASGSGATPGNNTDTNYPAGVGIGGGASVAGNGAVLLICAATIV